MCTLACRDFGSKYPEMLLDYKVPDIFPENLFDVLGKTRLHPSSFVLPTIMIRSTYKFSKQPIQDRSRPAW